MSFMFEVLYRSPADPRKEAALTARVAEFGGRLDFYEAPDEGGPESICLTYEFDSMDLAERAALALRQQGEHVEGPVDYGP